MEHSRAELCPAPLPSTAPLLRVAQHSPAGPVRNPSSSRPHPPAASATQRPDFLMGARRERPSASPAIPPQLRHLPSLMFLQARGMAGLLLCYFKGWLPREAKRLKQVGQEAGEGSQGTGRCLPGCTAPRRDALPRGGMHCLVVGCAAPRRDALCPLGRHSPGRAAAGTGR